MTRTVKVQEAKTHLSALLAAVAAGEDIIIARGDTPVARLSGLAQPGKRELGFVPYNVPASFCEPLSEVELAAWEA